MYTDCNASLTVLSADRSKTLVICQSERESDSTVCWQDLDISLIAVTNCVTVLSAGNSKTSVI